MARRMSDWDTCVCVVGVGFVGESLLQQFGRVFKSIGFDISQERIDALTPRLQSLKNVQLTTDPAALARGTHYFISVPTPLREDYSVNLDFILSAIRTILKHAKPGCSIIIESSVPVGTTRKLLGPYKDFFHCGMSPERIDPGRTQPPAAKIPKIVSALTPRALKQIVAIYERVFDAIIPVSKPEVAEMSKLFENCYRMVNIAYVNEMSDACRYHGIDPHEMINASATKPFGFQAFYPGLGVGGHCIPVNPFYLFSNNKHLPVLERATKLMLKRPYKLAGRFHRRCISRLMSKGPFDLYTLPRILIVGIGFKAGQSDISGSPALLFAQRLQELGCARLAFFDNMVQKHEVDWMEKLHDSQWTSAYLDNKFDALVICNQQEKADIASLRLQKAFVQSFVW